MQFVLVIYRGSEMSVSEEEKKAVYAGYARLIRYVGGGQLPGGSGSPGR